MADVNSYIEAVQNATNGREMRGSMADALKALENEATSYGAISSNRISTILGSTGTEFFDYDDLTRSY